MVFGKKLNRASLKIYMLFVTLFSSPLLNGMEMLEKVKVLDDTVEFVNDSKLDPLKFILMANVMGYSMGKKPSEAPTQTVSKYMVNPRTFSEETVLKRVVAGKDGRTRVLKTTT